MSDNVTQSTWRVFNPSSSAELRLICIPYAGGSANVSFDWAKNLPQQVEVCAVQMAGRQNRLDEPPMTRWQDVVDELVRDVAMFAEKPFALYGHSLGALISFELARRLQTAPGISPSIVFVSACRAPDLVVSDERPIHELTDQEFERKLRRYKGTPEAFFSHSELKQLLLPMLRADFEMYHRYRFAPGAQLRCPMVALGGISDQIESEQIAQWQFHTAGSFRMQMLPGDHFFLHKYQEDVLHVIEQELRPQLGSVNGVQREETTKSSRVRVNLE